MTSQGVSRTPSLHLRVPEAAFIPPAAVAAESSLKGLMTQSDEARQVVCLGLDLVRAGQLPSTAGGFEDRVLFSLGEIISPRMPRTQLAEIFEDLQSVASGDPDLDGIAQGVVCW